MSPRSVELTGGPVWHWRALQRRNVLWQPFRNHIADWLSTWRLRETEIILVGASAGWCLPSSFLARFEKIICIDLDRFAPILFRCVHRRVNARIEWVHADFFENAESILNAHSKAAVLLCNVAGQRRYVVSDIAAVEAEMSFMKTRLGKRCWASFHDLLSGSSEIPHAPIAYSGRRGHQSVIQDFGLSGEWLDHLTGDLLPYEGARRILPWRFDTQRLHLVEAGFGFGGV
jgi:hypothetical protein